MRSMSRRKTLMTVVLIAAISTVLVLKRCILLDAYIQMNFRYANGILPVGGFGNNVKEFAKYNCTVRHLHNYPVDLLSILFGDTRYVNRWQTAVGPDKLFVYSAYFEKKRFPSQMTNEIRVIAISNSKIYNNNKLELVRPDVRCTYWFVEAKHVTYSIIQAQTINMLEEHHDEW